MKRISGKQLVAVLLMGLFGCLTTAGAVVAGDTLKIGVPGAHSGDLASYGIPTIKAAAPF